MKSARFVSVLLVATALQGCATISREPFTESQQVDATIPGIPAARFWADAPDAALQMSPSLIGAKGEKTMFALSGGSDNGAYGAGILKGWSQAGTRPEFSIVTGVSTGALIAPLAFLGSDQDATLETVFTTISAIMPLTTQDDMLQDSRQAGALSQLEITPAMVRAGVFEIMEGNLSDLEQLAQSIYLAMALERLDSLGQL